MFHPPYAGELIWSRDDVHLDRVVAEEPCRVCGDDAEFVVIRDRDHRAAEQSEYPLCKTHAGWDELRGYSR